MRMPVFDVNELVADCTDYEAELVRGAFTARGVEKGKMRLRAAKPHKRVGSEFEGLVNYTWRMLCFDLAGFGQHACLPVCADFDACHGRSLDHPEEGWKERGDAVRAKCDEIDALIKRIEKRIPLEQKRGLVRWGRALGYF